MNFSYSGEGQTICVIDTGVDYDNFNLGDCSENDFLNGNCPTVIGGWDFFNGDNNPMEDNGHGTHVAGILISDDLQERGVSSGARVVAPKWGL